MGRKWYWYYTAKRSIDKFFVPTECDGVVESAIGFFPVVDVMNYWKGRGASIVSITFATEISKADYEKIFAEMQGKVEVLG